MKHFLFLKCREEQSVSIKTQNKKVRLILSYVIFGSFEIL